MPECILLFSGKRKSGKDYVTDLILKTISDALIIKISAPIKSHFSKTRGLNEEELMKATEYKEKYRLEMIEWSEKIRKDNPGVFCKEAIKLYNAETKAIWIVSDVRRKTDIEWFKTTYPNCVKTIRVEASISSRKARGWLFTEKIDDAPSECDLDDFHNWDWTIENNSGSDLQRNLLQIIDYITTLREQNHARCQ